MPRATRFPMILPLRYRVQGEADWSYGMTVDISYTGVLFRSDRTLAVQAPIEIEVVLPGDSEGSARVISQGSVRRSVTPYDAFRGRAVAVTIDEYELIRAEFVR
jgi:hypothetical protein